MFIKRNTALITMFFMVLCISTLSAQDTASLHEQTKLIRIKKIASEWQGSYLTLHTHDGQEINGKLLKVAGGYYHMEVGKQEIEIPLSTVIQVSFEPGMPELLLTMASAFMGGAFLSGALLIADEESSQQSVKLAALLGLAGGCLWGYSTFYETEVIELE